MTFAHSCHVQVSVELVDDLESAKPVRRVRWDVPLPSQFGLDIDALPTLPEEVGEGDDYVTYGWMREPRLSYETKNARRYVVCDFDGDVQDPEAETFRRSLLEAASKLNLNLHTPPRFDFRRNRAKVGFDDQGRLNFAAYFPKRPFPVDPNQIALELAD